MCLDIDPNSVIDKHIHQKILDLDRWHEQNSNPVTGEKEFGYHNLTMLPSFHISLGAPPVDIKPQKIKLFIDDFRNLGLQQIIGSIVLGNIFISEKNNKKSAWIDVQRLTWRIIDREVETQIVNEDSNLFILNSYKSKIQKENTTGKLPNWHISLANLTGKPQDSIARPEDCIVDTITA